MKYEYKYSAFGQNCKEKTVTKKPSKVPYKTIIAMSESKTQTS